MTLWLVVAVFVIFALLGVVVVTMCLLTAAAREDEQQRRLYAREMWHRRMGRPVTDDDLKGLM
jgi:type IV secretory pathway TrbD component